MDAHPIVIADASGMIRHWSAGAHHEFGHSSAVAVGKSLDFIVPPEFRDAHWHGFRASVASGASKFEGQTQQFPVQRADGSITIFRGTVTLLRNSQQRVLGVMVIFEPDQHPAALR